MDTVEEPGLLHWGSQSKHPGVGKQPHSHSSAVTPDTSWVGQDFLPGSVGHISQHQAKAVKGSLVQVLGIWSAGIPHRLLVP